MPIANSSGSTIDHGGVEFDLHLANVGTAGTTFSVAQLASSQEPPGLALSSPLTDVPLPAGQPPLVIHDAVSRNNLPRTPGTGETFVVEVSTLGGYTWDFSIPIDVYLDQCAGTDMSPTFSNSPGCCAGLIVSGGLCEHPAAPPPCTQPGSAIATGSSCCNPQQTNVGGYCEFPHCGEDSGPNLEYHCCIHTAQCRAGLTPTPGSGGSCYCAESGSGSGSGGGTCNPGEPYCACKEGTNTATFSCNPGYECDGTQCLPKQKSPILPPTPKPPPGHTIQ